MRRLLRTLGLAIAVALPATPALGQSAGSADEILDAVLPITPDQARELTTLLQSPDTVAADLVETMGAVIDAVPSLPAAILHDVVTTPVRDWHVLRGVVTDAVELASRPAGEPRGLFRHTIRALHRSRVFTAAAGIVRRVTRPTNRTARLAIVLMARGQGIPARTEHLDMLSRAIDRHDPDLGPLLLGLVDVLAEKYGREAVRLIVR